MLDLTNIAHHPVLTEMVDVLCAKTQNNDRSFFSAEIAYFLGKMASSMRATIVTRDRGEIPVNIYALALATSGFGKGHSVGIVETEFMKGFKRRFMEDTFPVIAETNLWHIANDRAARSGKDAQEEYDKAVAEFHRKGPFLFTFDSGTSPAVKDMRQKLLLANSGALNFQVDEIGSNLLGNLEVLTLFLELYDQGIVKQKLTKNTADNIRGEELDGKTPANMLLFGTPSKLFDGGPTESEFYSFLDVGYARRCIFGFGHVHRKAYETMTALEVFTKLTQPTNVATINKWATHFHKLADPAMYDWKIIVEDDVAVELLEYKHDCERLAEALPEHEEIRKAELSHRYFKALKLAGAYAFVDESNELEMGHLLSAIKLIEESGEAFRVILSREKAYVKLAKYIANVGEEVTHADLHEALPFYKAGQGARNEMMNLAIAHGYKNNIIIKKTFADGIELFKGETLAETNLEKIRLSYSEHWAYNYLNEEVPFDQIHLLTQAPEMHWTNHHLKMGHRAEENVLAGFNLIVIDVDGGVPITTVHELLKEYKFLTYTTKRHTEAEHRFRLVLPMNYYLELDSEEYKEFMNCFMAWLPFKVDEASNQRSKKWEAYENGEYVYNLDGEMIDIRPFIPKTKRNEEYRSQHQALESLDNMERWFAQRIATGNRNNHMIKFALAIVDSGVTLLEVEKSVRGFNAKLSNPLTDREISTTIMQTVAKRFEP